MRSIDDAVIRSFLIALGTRQAESAQLSLLGGCALILLGSPRMTIDIDYVGDDVQPTRFQQTIAQVAAELQLEADPVPIGRFVPLPADSEAHRVFVARFGLVDVYVVDPDVIALSKLDRGDDTDIDDVVFLVKRGLVSLDRLAELVASTLPLATKYDIDPAAMQAHLTNVRQRTSHL